VKSEEFAPAIADLTFFLILSQRRGMRWQWYVGKSLLR